VVAPALNQNAGQFEEGCVCETRVRTSGYLASDLRAVRVVEPAALEERAVLVAEAHRAVGANAVRELHAPAAPRCDAFHEGIAVVARVPRAAADQHRNLPTFVMRTQSATAMPRLIRPGTTRICRAQRRSSRENVSPLSRRPVGKVLPHTRACRSCAGHNRL